MDTKQGVTIEFVDATGAIPNADLAALSEKARQAIVHLKCSGSIQIRIVGDVEMAAAHEEFTGVAGTTDVLTFDLSDPEGDRAVLDADVMICRDEALRQSAERSHSPMDELLLYILHAVLHCLDYNDDTESGYRAMHEAEDSVLTAIGIGPIFGDRGGFQPH